jgi:5-methylthioribose kinase
MLSKVTEELIFTTPWIKHDSNHLGNALSSLVRELQCDEELLLVVAKSKLKLLNRMDCFLHGDLHTGSIMGNLAECKVIDPEFSSYGPFGFDLGMLAANLLIPTFIIEGTSLKKKMILETTKDLLTRS